MPKTALFIWLLPVLISTASCRKNRVVTEQPSTAAAIMRTEDPAFADSLTAKANAFSGDWKTLNAKVKIDAAGTMLTASLRMQRDTIAWISVSAAMGIEAVRIMITPDSVFYINRLSGEKRREAGEKAALLAGFPLNLRLVQAMLLGAIPEATWNKKERVLSDTAAVILLSAPKFSCGAQIDTQNYTLTKMVLTALAGEREMKINFGGYASASGRPFSFDRQYRISNNTGGIEATVHFVRAVFNEPLPGFPFDAH